MCVCVYVCVYVYLCVDAFHNYTYSQLNLDKYVMVNAGVPLFNPA